MNRRQFARARDLQMGETAKPAFTSFKPVEIRSTPQALSPASVAFETGAGFKAVVPAGEWWEVMAPEN